jgi:DNA polymerase I
MESKLPFREICAADFEFTAHAGERPGPVCLVARELRSGREIRLWQDELHSLTVPPYSIGEDSLFVAYYSSAELGCHLALGWPLPANVLDLYCEFRNRTNGLHTPCGRGLVGALAWFGLDGIEAIEKEEMRNLVLQGGPWSPEEREAILEYCASDVHSLERLLPNMESRIDLPRALLRGRYMKAVARMEYAGVPIDMEALAEIKTHWFPIQDALIRRIGGEYGIYDRRTFKRDRFEQFLAAKGIPWARLDSGSLDLSDDMFRDMARAYSIIAPIRELRTTLSQMRLSELAVGNDGRNRCLLSPYSSRTSRNQPSNSKFIFGPSTWIRSLIRPEPGRGIAYIDFEQQEFGIAAALSNDPLMMEAYQSGDPYLAFAKQAGVVPTDATKDSHKAQRETFKACILGTQYGMGAKTLARRIGKSEADAKELLRCHKETYKMFWKWSDGVVDYALLYGRLWTVFGWHLHIDGEINPRSIRNFPMQANGAEILRLTCILATERGVTVVAPVHDAILIEFDLQEEFEAIHKAEQTMREASRIVLNSFELRTEARVVRYPDRYCDERGEEMWKTVWDLIDEMEPRTGTC